MAETWKVNTGFNDTSLQDLHDVIFHGMLGIKNLGDGILEIINIFLNEAYPSVSLAGPAGSRSIYRITGLSGGEALPVSKHDTDNANLPAQVSIVSHPTSVTTTDVLHSDAFVPGAFAHANQAPASLALRSPGLFASVANFQRDVGGATQRFVLNEGQGVAWKQDRSPHSHQQWTLATVRVVSTGACYTIFSTRTTPRWGEDALLAIMNGSGSGVVLELVVLYAEASGSSSPNVGGVNNLRILPCSDVTDGDLLTPIPYDTNNAALPAGVTFRRDCNVVPGGLGRSGKPNGLYHQIRNSGFSASAIFLNAFAQMGTFRGVCNDFFWHAPDTGAFGAPMVRPTQRRKLFDFKSGEGLKLRKGESLAICRYYHHVIPGSANSFDSTLQVGDNFDLLVDFTWTPVAAGGSGGISRSRIIGGA